MSLFSRMSLGLKLTVMNVCNLILLAIVLIGMVAIEIRQTMVDQAIARQESNLKVAMEVLRSKGGDFTLRDDKLYVGDVPLNDDEEIVDHINDLIGGVTTIFMRDMRVATNIKKPDGSRATGTLLAQGPAWHAVFYDRQVYQGEADILGQPYFVRYQPIVDGKGDVIGCLFVGLAQQQFMSIVATLLWHVTGLAVVLTLALGIPAWIGNRRNFQALHQVQAVLLRLAEGQVTNDIPHLQRQDEIGRIAGAVRSLRDHMTEATRLRGEQERQKQVSAEDRKQMLSQLADDFEGHVLAVVNEVLSSSSELQTAAKAMRTIASESTSQATAVTAAAEQTTNNVQLVSTAADDLYRAIAEISLHVSEAASISSDAAEAVDKTNAMVCELTEAAEQIGKAIELIASIAAQTNLLALNATIEAARSGEAGKGFAVVANEVKLLANQTARATDEIEKQISAVQEETKRTVGSIKEISGIITHVREISSSIAAAVEEQGAATQEIARNVQHAAAGTDDVAHNIGGVTKSATITGATAEQVLSAANSLAAHSERLRGEVVKFLQEVRVG